MKKNIIGPMVPSSQATGRRLRRLGIFPKILCLLIALSIWLLVTNFYESEKETPWFGTSMEETVK